MYHRKVKSVLGKLGMFGVYILFLLVQLNLKYTLLNATATSIASVAGNDLNNSKSCKSNSATDQKSSVLQLRLNKRYFHQEVYQVSYLPKKIVVDFSLEPKQFIYQVPILQVLRLLHSPLRGPPAARFVMG